MSTPPGNIYEVLGMKPPEPPTIPSEPVWVGPPPKLSFYSTDRWSVEHPWPWGTWYVSEPGMMEYIKWLRVKDFQTLTAEMVPKASPELLKLTLEEILATPYGKELNRKILHNPSRTTVWEMNVVIKMKAGQTDYMRLIPASTS